MAVYEEIFAELLTQIVHGEFEPGESLPTYAELAAEYDRSIGTVREAAQALKDRGLVHVKHGVRAVVRPELEWSVLDRHVLRALLDSPKEHQVLGEYLEARRLLEIEAAGLAAERAGDEDVVTLNNAFNEMVRRAERAKRTSAAEAKYREADVEFHRAIIVASRNRALIGMTEAVHVALEETRSRLARPPARFKRGLPEHKRILDAIAAKDPDGAREAMRAHLETVEGYLKDLKKRRRKAARSR